MPFRLINAPLTFQAYMNHIMQDLTNITYIVYIDNILIFLEDLANYIDYIKQVLQQLSKNKLYANIDKCKFNTILV